MTNGRRHTGEEPAVALTGNVGGFAHDMAELAELQAKLLLVDSKQAGTTIGVATGLAVVGAALLFGCFPILLTGAAYWLHEGREFSFPAAFLTAGVVGAVISVLFILAAWLVGRRAGAAFKTSKDEFAYNVKWVKSVLKNPSGSGPWDVRG